MSEDAGALPECKVKTLMITPLICTILGRFQLDLVGLPGKALACVATRSLWFLAHAAGWLHSMVLHGLMADGVSATTANLSVNASSCAFV